MQRTMLSFKRNILQDLRTSRPRILQMAVVCISLYTSEGGEVVCVELTTGTERAAGDGGEEARIAQEQCRDDQAVEGQNSCEHKLGKRSHKCSLTETDFQALQHPCFISGPQFAL